MKRFFKENGLSLVLFGLFLFSLAGQYFTGWNEHNDDQRLHGEPAVTLAEYLTSGHFIEATFENWESEFLQMAAYVLLTVFLYQKGSAESKEIDAIQRVDRTIKRSKRPKPWAVKRGGWILKLYENSLSLALLLLFLISFALHAVGGVEEYNEEQKAHGAAQVSTLEYMTTSRFWFESFQNWQSEFLSVGAIVVLTIFLRQKGSPESKPVDVENSETGSE